MSGSIDCSPVDGPAGMPVCCCSWAVSDEVTEQQALGAPEGGGRQTLRAQNARPRIADSDRRWGCFPSLFVPGAQKAGTTALAALLSLIPSVSPPAVKEPHELDLKRWPARARTAAALASPGSLRPLSYLTVLGGDPADAGRGLFTFDPTPAYMLAPATVRRMARVAPAARVIVMVRGARRERGRG